MIKNGRQMSPTLDGIRDDHVLRYRFAVDFLRNGGLDPTDLVIDAGAGCGYGSFILASEGGFRVTSIEQDVGAVDYASQHYDHNSIVRIVGDLASLATFRSTNCLLLDEAEALVGFEIIEHLPDPGPLLTAAARANLWLVGSVPNEDVVPFGPKVHSQHFRHYRPAEVKAALESASYEVVFLGGQRGKRGADGKVVQAPGGCRTLVFAARPAAGIATVNRREDLP